MDVQFTGVFSVVLCFQKQLYRVRYHALCNFRCVGPVLQVVQGRIIARPVKSNNYPLPTLCVQRVLQRFGSPGNGVECVVEAVHKHENITSCTRDVVFDAIGCCTDSQAPPVTTLDFTGSVVFAHTLWHSEKASWTGL